MTSHSCKLTAGLLLALAPACASNPPPATPAATTSPRLPSAILISRDEMRARDFQNAYDAVAALHPNWMNLRGVDTIRGNSGPSQVLVYHDNMMVGGIETLKSISITGIEYIRYYDRLEATDRWGIDHGQGVIFVSSRPLK